MAQLHPTSFFTLAVFQHLCEAFVGVMPSVALFRNYFYLRVEKKTSLSSGVVFRFCDRLKSEFIEPGKKIETEWSRDWCWVRTDELQEFHEEPLGPSKGSDDWTLHDPNDAELAPICAKIRALRDAGLTDMDVARHFIGRRVAPCSSARIRRGCTPGPATEPGCSARICSRRRYSSG